MILYTPDINVITCYYTESKSAQPWLPVAPESPGCMHQTPLEMLTKF